MMSRGGPSAVKGSGGDLAEPWTGTTFVYWIAMSWLRRVRSVLRRQFLRYLQARIPRRPPGVASPQEVVVVRLRS
jgi:hypothetical protein